MFRLKNLFQPKKASLPVSRLQREMLELLISNKADFTEWISNLSSSKIRFQFYYPNAIDFFYDEFKLFTAYFKKDREGISLQELKMSDTNRDTIQCNSWDPFEQTIQAFLLHLEDKRKLDLFEKRKTLFEYQKLCATEVESKPAENYSKEAAKLPFLRTAQ